MTRVDSFTSVIIPIIVKMEEDIRERVLYISHIFIDTSIRGYQPTAHDLDYPTKLYRAVSVLCSSVEYYAQRRNKDYKWARRGVVSRSIYSVWYTPVQKVLRVLSLLYTCIDVSLLSFTHL